MPDCQLLMFLKREEEHGTYGKKNGKYGMRFGFNG
jgi:hypothetical protein